MKIFLIGYMGCGKTSLGRKLSKATEMRLLDMDATIEQREGASISDIFRYEGEEYFRGQERSLIEEAVSAEENMIISTGGGVPTWSDNMDYINAHGLTIYLRRTPEQIASRLSEHGRQKRPKLRNLNDEELVAFMTANMAEREPYYSKARHCIDCAELSDTELVEIILDIIKSNE